MKEVIMKEIKAIFFDIDGTTYTHDTHEMIDSTKKALIELKKAGYRVGIATSRCRYEVQNMPSFFRNFEFDGYVFDGGASVYDKKELFDASYIEPSVIEELIEFQKEYNFDLRYATLKRDFQHKKISQNYLDLFFYLYLNSPLLKPYDGDQVTNMLIHGDEKTLKELEKKLHDVHYNFDAPVVLEITAKGVGKHYGIEKLATHWGIDMKEVMVFGDGMNDLTMLKHAGVGVAMGNGCDEAKAAGDYVCGKLKEDGIYNFLKEHEMI